MIGTHKPKTYLRQAQMLAGIAEALEDAQRALNHLEALDDCWEQCDEEERREGVQAAIKCLDGTWNGRGIWPPLEGGDDIDPQPGS